MIFTQQEIARLRRMLGCSTNASFRVKWRSLTPVQQFGYSERLRLGA